MLEAGVTMLRSLDVILSQIQSKELYMAVKQTHDDIEQGSSLSAGLEPSTLKFLTSFGSVWLRWERLPGTMPLVLNKLAEHVEQDAAFQSAIISAMVYPMILFVVCIGAVVFFALVVGPKFEEVFKSMHADLPVMTRCLLGTFDFIKHYILYHCGRWCRLYFLF